MMTIKMMIYLRMINFLKILSIAFYIFFITFIFFIHIYKFSSLRLNNIYICDLL